MPQDEDFKLPKQNTLAKRLDKNKLDKAIDAESMENVNDLLENAVNIADLTKSQRRVLKEEIHDFMTESSRSVVAIAEKLEIHPETVYTAHRAPVYRQLFTQLTDQIFMDMAHIGYSGIIKGARDGKVSASKLILEVTGKYTPKHQTENVNVNVNVGSDNMTPIAAIERFLTLLGARGWSIEQLTEIWNNLKQSQAF